MPYLLMAAQIVFLALWEAFPSLPTWVALAPISLLVTLYVGGYTLLYAIGVITGWFCPFHLDRWRIWHGAQTNHDLRRGADRLR